MGHQGNEMKNNPSWPYRNLCDCLINRKIQFQLICTNDVSCCYIWIICQQPYYLPENICQKKCVLRKINVRLMFLKSLLGKAQLPLKQKRQNNKHSWKWYIHHFCSTFVCTNQNEKYQIPTQNCLIISICIPSVTRKLSVVTNLCQL